MSVTWTSGYSIGEAVPFVEWNRKGTQSRRSPAGTLTFTRNSMCGMFTFEYETTKSMHSALYLDLSFGFVLCGLMQVLLLVLLVGAIQVSSTPLS